MFELSQKFFALPAEDKRKYKFDLVSLQSLQPFFARDPARNKAIILVEHKQKTEIH